MYTIIKSKNGFSLIEVLVALSIFTMVITAAVGALLMMVDANKRAQNINSIMTNISFALDSMTRDIRTGSNYYCQHTGSTANAGAISSNLPTSGNGTRDCTSNPKRSFAFKEGGNSLTSGCPTEPWMAFRHNPPNNFGKTGWIERRICDGDGNSNVNQNSDWERMTSSDVDIRLLEFTVSGASAGDSLPPRVTIHIEARVPGTQQTAAGFSMQTTVTQQLIDI